MAVSRLRIVAVNDVYLLDNLPRLKTLVERARTEDPADRLLVTLAGDFVAPSLLSSLDAGRGMVECLNALGLTHVTLGNHEDDVATPELSARLRELACPCLGTNVRGFRPELPVHDVVQVGAVRVGLVGVVMNDATVYQRVPFGGATLLDPNDSVRDEATRLLQSGCDAVIALTHQGVELDRALLASGAKVTLVLGGHEHQVFLEQVHDTWIVKAGSDAFHAAVVDLAWDGGAPTVRVRLEDVSRYPEDPALRALVDGHLEQVKALASATLLVPPHELSSVGARVRQTSLGTLFATQVREALHADACVFNGGGIRGARTYQARFSFGDLETEVPFANEMVTAPLPGAVLQAAIAFSRAHAPVEFGGFLQVCDAVTLDEGARIVAIGGQPFDAERIYRVALVRNLFTGMDGVQPLVDFAGTHPDAIPEPGAGRDVKLVLLESFARALWTELGGFDQLDADHDGVVNEADLVRGLEGHTGGSPVAATAGILLRALDLDHDGQMSRTEADFVVPKK